MTEEMIEQLVERVEDHLSEELDYPSRAGSYNEGELTVFVDTYEVVDDTRGCVDEIVSAISEEFPELEYKDSECYEMVMVSFKIVKND